jgi:hypothetical protein
MYKEEKRIITTRNPYVTQRFPLVTDSGVRYNGHGRISLSPNKIRELVGFPPIKESE